MNLLLVDDEPVSVQGMLAGVNWKNCGIGQVFEAYSARMARKIFQKERIDVALLDIEMPEESGILLLEWIRGRYPREKLPCAFLTCHADFRYAQEAIRLGCTDYLFKPVDYHKVEQLVMQLVKTVQRKDEELRMQKYGEQWLDEKYNHAMEQQKPAANVQELVDQTAGYILEHISEKLLVEDLAVRVHLNSDYLNRLFKKYRGKSINKFIIDERMQLAMELLRRGDLTAGAVAVQVGYENYANFTNMFKKVYDMLPSQVLLNEEK